MKLSAASASGADVILDDTYVGIRAKGNTSLSMVQSYGNRRYSFKVEFDHYGSAKSYHGLDKLSLNNIIQDTTYMKDYLTYTLMRSFGVAAPLCSYVQVSVNGSEWGLYLAVEGVEDSFLSRNYGSAQGQLYKPDSMDIGGTASERGEFGHEVPSPPQMPDGGTRPFGNAAPSMPFEGMGQNMPTPEDAGTAPQEFVGQNFRPTDGGMTQSNQPGNMAVLPLVISLVLLMVGLAIALKFKR